MKGCVLKRGSKWAVVLHLGRDEAGRRRQKWHSGFDTKREAEAACASLITKLNSGTYVAPAKLTVAAYMRHWLEAYARPNVAAKTRERYGQIVETHIVPRIGDIPMTRLSAMRVQALYSELLHEGRLDGKPGGLAPSTVIQLHRILRQAFSHAVEWGMLGSNPVARAKPPARGYVEMQTLSAREAAALLREAEGTPLYLPILLGLATGLRRGELCGLQWADFDAKSGVVQVRRSVQVTKAGVSLKQPKTRCSRRPVTLPSLAVDALVQHRAEQARERVLLGLAPGAEGFILGPPTGEPQNPDHLSANFAHWLARRPHLRRVRFHDLRHSCATLLLLAGEHPKIVSSMLGHATVAITMDVYSHVTPGMEQAAARRLDDTLRSALGD